MKFVFFRFRRTEKIESVMKELMGQCPPPPPPPQNFWARTAPVHLRLSEMCWRQSGYCCVVVNHFLLYTSLILCIIECPELRPTELRSASMYDALSKIFHVKGSCFEFISQIRDTKMPL